MSWKTLCQMDLHGKRVLTRVDLNVPMLDGKVTDATRINKIVPTVNEIIKNGGNSSMIHVDWIIGSNTINIDGLDNKGSATPDFRNGEWAS